MSDIYQPARQMPAVLPWQVDVKGHPQPDARLPQEPCYCGLCTRVIIGYSQEPLAPFYPGLWGPPVLTPSAHDPLELAEVAAHSFVSSRYQTLNQVIAIVHWKARWLGSNEHKELLTSTNLTRTRADALLRMPIQIFNDLFFLGNLPLHAVNFTWDYRDFHPSASVEDEDEFRGCTRVHPVKPSIFINPTSRFHRHSPDGILQTLLHEMIHAFLSRYSAHQGAYMPVGSRCWIRHVKTYGVTAHGTAWQYLAKAIEDHGPRYLPGFKISLGRDEAVPVETGAHGWRPSEQNVRDLFGRYEDRVRFGLEQVREVHDAVFTWRIYRWTQLTGDDDAALLRRRWNRLAVGKGLMPQTRLRRRASVA